MDKLLTTSEVANYFGVTSNTVTAKFTKQGLKFFPISCKEYRYNIKDVLAFEEKMKVNFSKKENIDLSEIKMSKTKRNPNIKFID